jgi:glycosyltransferase involved in cell wall biosynthesis
VYVGSRISVIIPARNEELAIVNVVRTIPGFVDHIILVDDGSTDNTYVLASEIRDRRLRIIRREKSAGVGGAILDGHRLAMNLGSNVDVVMAGDGQMDPTYMPKLLEPIVSGACAYSKGDRFASRRLRSGMPPQRIIGNCILTLLMKITIGRWDVSDPQNGYTAIRTSALKKIPLERVTQGYLFENDMLLHLALMGARVKDIAIPARYPQKHSQMRTRKFISDAMGFFTRAFAKRWLRRDLP